MTRRKTKELRKRAMSALITSDEEFEKYPKLFLFFYDEVVDRNYRKQGMSKECYEKISNHYKTGEYPEHLRWLAEKELNLKLRDK